MEETLQSDRNVKRVQDIISKSMWDRPKMISLAVTQAKLITKIEKATERAKAAEDILGPCNIITIIFNSRAMELGPPVRRPMRRW